MENVLITDSWPKVSYYFIIYLYINLLISTMTRAIIIRIKDRANHRYKEKLNKTKSNKEKEETNTTSEITRDRALVT